jgi:hypothetical protein
MGRRSGMEGAVVTLVTEAAAHQKLLTRTLLGVKIDILFRIERRLIIRRAWVQSLPMSDIWNLILTLLEKLAATIVMQV